MAPEISQPPPTPEDLDNGLATVDELPPDAQALVRGCEADMIRDLPEEVRQACAAAGLQLDRSECPIFTTAELRKMLKLSEEYYDRERDRAAAEALADERTGGVND